jgi:hypothetical protein
VSDIVQDRDVWEPWAPEVGQRVRVRISPECDARFIARYTLNGEPATGAEHHFPEAHGATGIVTEVVTSGREAINGHRFHVQFDRGVSVPGTGHLLGICVAAIEMEPVQ